MEGHGTQWKEQVTKRKLLVTKEARLNTIELGRRTRNVVEHCGTFQMEPDGTLWNMVEQDGRTWNCRMFYSILECKSI
jgi:hypothetical protein